MSKPKRSYVGSTGLDFLGENDEETSALRPVAPAPAPSPAPVAEPKTEESAQKPAPKPAPPAATDKPSPEPTPALAASSEPTTAPVAETREETETAKPERNPRKPKKLSREAKLTLVTRRPSGVPSDTAGFERTTYWMDPHLKLKIQEKAYWERMQIFQVVNLIVEDYFKRHPVKQAQ